MTSTYTGRFGPLALERGYRLRLYAPAAQRVDALVDGRTLPMERRGDWFAVDDEQGRAGSRYAFSADGGGPIPDPGSRFQPDGVHAASEIVASHFAWPDDGWRGRPWHEHVMYELHVGTFTFEGTYEAAGRKLRELVALGITAIELMPIAAFPGARNWGYDGVLPYAPYAGYGKPDDLRHFIAAAHAHGLAVLLDVVYNHFGPEGNYLHTIAPGFFNETAHTPWGAAIDVTVPDVRAYFAENAAYWLTDYRFDGLRLDATHAIVDPLAPSFLSDLRKTALAACETGRHVALVVENDDNDITLLDDGYDAQWNDDVHHCAHVIATGETGGYYRDYADDPAGWLGRALTTGFAYQGEASEHRGDKPRGLPSARFRLSAFVSFLQNHDQIGNRAFGERIAQLAAPEALRALTTLILLAPSPPLLFKGEEWAASTPFLFFCDFEPDLARLVTEGRRREFEAFPQFADASVRATIPDPAAVTTFETSRLRWEERSAPQHAAALAFTTAILHARAHHVVPFVADVRGTDAVCERIGASGLALRWKLADGTLHADANLSGDALDGFPERLTGETFYTTHDPIYHGRRAPAWAVRWSRT
jgi:malto-oligosyltrehalose trehalohydrolase